MKANHTLTSTVLSVLLLSHDISLCREKPVIPVGFSDTALRPVRSSIRAGFSEIREAEIQNPKHFNLLGNYPNPFNAQTTIQFETAEQSHVKINLYDLRGRFQFNVHDAMVDPGLHRIQVNGAQLCSGLYVYRFLAWNLQGNLLMDQGCKILLIK